MRFVLPILVLVVAAAWLPGCEGGSEDATDDTVNQENFEWTCGTSPEFAICRCYLTDPTDPNPPETSPWGPPVDICPASKDCCVTYYDDASGHTTCACLESSYYDGVCAPPKTPPGSMIVPSCPPPG